MSNRELTTEDLLRACLDGGSKDSWSEFIRRFQPLIAGCIMRVVRSHGDVSISIVDDLVQDTYLRLCRDDCKQLRTFIARHDEAIFGFLKVVAISVAMDFFRARSAQKRAGEDSRYSDEAIALVAASNVHPDQLLLLQEVANCLEQIVTTDQEEKIFWLYYQQGLSANAISQMPNIELTAKGVESCLYRLTRLLKEMLAQSGRASNKLPKGISQKSTFGEVG